VFVGRTGALEPSVSSPIETADEPEPVKRSGIFLSKVVITGALLAWVLSRADLAAVGAQLRGAHPRWVLLALLLCAGNIFVGTFRWRLVLRALGIRFPAGRAMQLCWSAQFFNTFLPSGVVGDALRGAWTARGSDPVRAVASVVLDRVCACIALAIAVGIGLTLPVARTLPGRPGLLIAAAILGVVASALLAFPYALARVAARTLGPRLERLLGGQLAGPVAAGPRLVAVALALVTQALLIATVVALAHGATVTLPLAATIAVVPAVMATAYVPISISGIGLREVALVALLRQVGVPAGGALAISVLLVVVTWSVSLMGGLVYLVTRHDRGPAPAGPGPASLPSGSIGP
jgi:hypothetical protein